MFNLENKKAFVTGASGGIGRAIARRLHAQGAEVALSGTRQEVLEEVAHDLGSRAHVVPCNLSDEAAVATLPAKAEEVMGPVDILVNNAGMTRDNLFLRLKDEDWHQVMSVNLTATFLLSRGFVRGMMKRRWGRIVGITSVVGVVGNRGQGNYAASKAGMVGMSKALAQEVASRGITVNCVAPGFIGTDMTDDAGDGSWRERILTQIPVGSIGQPDDVSAAVLYLASEEAAYVTGQTLHVNGGMAMV
ncbi:MAG: 3-oxoacyl-[acyl-carrier-protein] reductase [Parvularculales bacterium]